jgi:hypothetical protein
VLGQWGEEAFTSFPPGSIAVDPSLKVQVLEFHENDILGSLHNLSSLVSLPYIEGAYYCVGYDYGYSPDPSSITICFSRDRRVWYELARIHLFRVKQPIQVRFIMWLLASGLRGNCLALSTDDAKLVQAVEQVNHDTYDNVYAGIVHHSDPGSATTLTTEDGKEVMGEDGKPIRQPNKQYFTEELRLVFQSTLTASTSGIHLWLGEDKPLIDALSGMTERKTGSIHNHVVYECAEKEQEHDADSLRYLIHAALAATKREEKGEDMRAYEGALGWAGPASSSEYARAWTAPWR